MVYAKSMHAGSLFLCGARRRQTGMYIWSVQTHTQELTFCMLEMMFILVRKYLNETSVVRKQFSTGKYYAISILYEVDTNTCILAGICWPRTSYAFYAVHKQAHIQLYLACNFACLLQTMHKIYM